MEFVSSALQKTNFYHNAADRELCSAPRKWFMLVFVPLISMCGLSSLSFFPQFFFVLFCFFCIVYLCVCVSALLQSVFFLAWSDVSEHCIDS